MRCGTDKEIEEMSGRLGESFQEWDYGVRGREESRLTLVGF